MHGEVFDKGPWTARRSDGNGVFVESDDFTHDVRLYVNGDFRDEDQCLAYAESLAEALTTAQAEIEALREDAERWRAFFGSERFYVMGAAGFDWEKAAVREPRDETNWLHFTLNVWDRHPAGNDEQGVQGRAMLLSYVDYLRRAALSGSQP